MQSNVNWHKTFLSVQQKYPSLLAALVMAACFIRMTIYHGLTGSAVPYFLGLFGLAALAYFIAVIRLDHDHLPIGLIWGIGIFFRLIFLTTFPSLSTDSYRYIWDAHLLDQGVNPYVLAVNAPLLDPYEIPIRAYVKHGWMASPYLPAAQLLFYFTNRIAPENVLAFQIAMTVLDLGAAWLVFNLLKILSKPKHYVLLYLWHPLIVIEFSHAAHQDVWMIFLTLLSFWLLARSNPETTQRPAAWLTASALSLSAATLTKVLPVLLVPLFLSRWKWKYTWLYLASTAAVLVGFAFQVGWGLAGEMDGTGVFGAIRIYLYQWNYNGSIYHWLETWLTGISTPGAVPLDAATQTPIFTAKLITAGLLGASILLTAWFAWQVKHTAEIQSQENTLNLLHLATIPIGAYLLLTATVHPWYLTFIVPFLVFMLPDENGTGAQLKRFIWPWLYLSCSVSISYLTYINLADLHEYPIIRIVEYYPFYILLAWTGYLGIKHVLQNIHTKHMPQDC